jgi:hypothetical protein
MQRWTSSQSASTGTQRVAASAFLLAAIIASATMSGCIVREIRDEMVTSNQSISDSNLLLQGIREDINQTNVHLASLQERLDRQFEQLQKLQSIDGSLTAIDAHLASLRKTLENIDSTIPLLSFADDAEDEATTQPATQPASQPESQPANLPAQRNNSAPATQPRPRGTGARRLVGRARRHLHTQRAELG